MLGVLDVGGSHVTAALALPHPWRLVGERSRSAIRPDAGRDEILERLSAAALSARSGHSVPRWCLAIPGPFDYVRGVAWYADVGKFEHLHGVDVRTPLSHDLGVPADSVRFVNDAAAFALGQWSARSATGVDRLVALTFGTGLGSAFVERGALVTDRPDVPAAGFLYDLPVGGGHAEDLVSARALLAAHERITGERVSGVRQLAARVRQTSPGTRGVFADAFDRFALAFRDVVDRFAPQVVVVGGSVALAWDLIEPSFRAGLRDCRDTPPRVDAVTDTEGSALLGAAVLGDPHRRPGARPPIPATPEPPPVSS